MPISSPYRLLVVEDEPQLRANLVRWLALAGYDVVGAGDAEEALALFETRGADLVVTDYALPGLSGIDLMMTLRERDPDVAFIFLTGHATVDVAVAALREGRAFDFLCKPIIDLSQLARAVEGALSRRGLAASPHERAPSPDPQPDGSELAGVVEGLPADGHAMARLSPRDLQILRLVGAGLGNKEIAHRLGRSEKTIRNQLSAIYAKLGVETRTQAALMCQERELI